MRVNMSVVGLVLVLCWMSPVLGDSRQAYCEVWRDGDWWKGASGPCLVSQWSGHISIQLRNGDYHDLRPTRRVDHYRDQRNNRVIRRSVVGGQQFFWEGGKEIVVRRDPARHRYGPPAAELGRTPYNLRELLGMKSSLAWNEMWWRGYEPRATAPGDDEYVAWRERVSGRCVMTRNAYGRLVSAVYAPERDCGR